jgi:large subunit ribosomal protein L24
MKIRVGDRVRVLQGKDRGKEGDVMRVLPEKNKVIVDGVNVAKRHQRATRATMQGGIIDKDMPLPVSSVAILCPTDGPTRIGYRFEETGTGVKKIRICRKCGGDLPKKGRGEA